MYLHTSCYSLRTYNLVFDTDFLKTRPSEAGGGGWFEPPPPIISICIRQSKTLRLGKCEPNSDLLKIKGLKETTHGYKKKRNKANDFTCKLQYDVSIFSNRRQSDFTKCSLKISQREIMISRLV